MKKFLSLLLAGTLVFMPATVFAQETVAQETVVQHLTDAEKALANATQQEIIAEADTKAAEELIEKSNEQQITEALDSTVGEKVSEIRSFLKKIFTIENLFKLLGAVLMIIIIWIIFSLIKKGAKRACQNRVSKHASMLITRVISYIFYIVICAYILSLFGISLNALWGAAGIAGVAIGFAAQTSVSNLISGLFVLSEKTMKIGDFITVGDVTGTVDSIGLLSVKIHTLDNQMVRIPNSSIINSNFVNNNYFDKRRITFSLCVSYDADLRKALEVLLSVPEKCPSALKDPAPAAWYENLGDSGMDVILAVWFKPENLANIKNEIFINSMEALDKAGIEVPYDKVEVKVLNS